MGTLPQMQDRQGDVWTGTLENRRLGTRERASHQAMRVRMLAGRAADEVVRSGESVALSAMTDEDREIVREHLRWRTDLVARSEGEGPERHVVVIPI